MDALTISAASGLRSRMESLDMLANNLANAATSGYKTDREFYGLYSGVQDEALSPDQSATVLPVIERPWTDFSQGTLTPTGNPLDMAVSGKGFFAVQGTSGTLYTRNGNFKADASGAVKTSDGYPVLLQGGGKIQLQPSVPVDVATDGTVSQGGRVLGRLQVVQFADSNALTKAGNSYFQAADPQVKPTAATNAEVLQGKLEGSNVGTAEAAVRLVAIMRQFEMLQKAISLGTEMNSQSIQEVARVGS
jgi:flagellar basal-body rod protein FlgF